MAFDTQRRHDRVARTWRFVCGALFGMLVGLWCVVAVYDVSRFVGGIVASELLGGFLSARFGVRFWEAVRHLQWFVP
jgi:hypothetical protein